MKKFPLFLTLFLFCLEVAFAQNFTFKENAKQSDDYELVKFSNGDLIKNLKTSSDPKETWGYKINFFDSKGKSKYNPYLIENDIVEIKAAYPNSQNALVAVISSGSSGSCCPFRTYYVAYLSKNELYVHELNTSMTGDLQITVKIAKDSLVAIDALNVSENIENKYGDTIKGTRALVLGKGFTKKQFKHKYLDLVGAHPEKFFSHKLYREKIANALGHADFKKLRSFMSVASDSELVDGQYIIFSGMLPHSGGSQSGTLIIDAINDDFWSFWFDEDAKNSAWQGATAQWNQDIANLILSNHKYASERIKIDFKNNIFSISNRK